MLTAGTATVSFPIDQWDQNYLVLVTGNATESFKLTAKGPHGFTITSSNAASTASVDWMAVRIGT